MSSGHLGEQRAPRLPKVMPTLLSIVLRPNAPAADKGTGPSLPHHHHPAHPAHAAHAAHAALPPSPSLAAAAQGHGAAASAAPQRAARRGSLPLGARPARDGERWAPELEGGGAAGHLAAGHRRDMAVTCP